MSINGISSFDEVLSEFKRLRYKLYKEPISDEERQELLQKVEVLGHDLTVARRNLPKSDARFSLRPVGSRDKTLIDKLLLKGIVIAQR